MTEPWRFFGNTGGGGAPPADNIVSDFDGDLQEVWEMGDAGPDTLVGAKNGFNLNRVTGTPSFGETGINGDCIQHDATSYFTRAFGAGFGFKRSGCRLLLSGL